MGCKKITTKLFGIKWPNTVKVLGIHFGHNKNELENLNIDSRINKIKCILNVWKQRNLSLKGRILIVKTFGVSQMLYVASVLKILDQKLHEVENYFLCLYGMESKIRLRNM